MWLSIFYVELNFILTKIHLLYRYITRTQKEVTAYPKIFREIEQNLEGKENFVETEV